jgi:uncharacterized protein DUF5753
VIVQCCRSAPAPTRAWTAGSPSPTSTAPDIAYLDNPLAGQVVERADDVARVTLLYDILKAEALPRQASIDLARKAIERWT